MRLQDKRAIEEYRRTLQRIRSFSHVNPLESKADQKQRIEHATKDVNYFVATYFKHYADSDSADFQIALAKRVKRNKTARELVRWGRGLAKSVWCDLFIPLWLWINDEDVFLVLVGNTYDAAKKLIADVQAEFEANELLLHDFGEQRLNGSWADGDFQTKDNRFIGVALGMGQSPRGLRKGKRRPNLIVADDLEDRETSKNPKRQDEVVNWIERDLIPTMDGETRRYMQPNNDPWRRSIQNQLEKRHPDWHVDLVKAYNQKTYKPAWHQKYSDTYYKEVENDLGTIAARAEYNHQHHTEGKIFTDALIQWGKPPKMNQFQIIVGFWDVAFSGNSDYNAVKVWGLHGRNFWHLAAFVRQCKMEDAIRWMYDYAAGTSKTTIVHWYVESQFWNDPLREALKAVETEMKRPLNISIVERPRMKKYDRIITMHPYYQNGRVYWNENEYASNDMQEGLRQLKSIEPGYKTHDDAPDADEQAINELMQYVREDAFKPRITSKAAIRSRYSKNIY